MTASSLPSEVYEQIGYDAALEGEGLRRLTELDLEGCRKSLGRLAAGLRLDQLASLGPGAERAVVGLLLEVLHQINRRVHAVPAEADGFHTTRLALVERFASCATAEAAREAFGTQLNRLLARLGGGARQTHTVVERARRYIDAHFAEKIFLSSVATKLNVSPNYLSRLFREQVGTTLTHYVQQRRVEQARMMLAAGSGTISEIAYRVGYQTYRDFYRNFVKLEGASPRVVQRRLNERRTG